MDLALSNISALLDADLSIRDFMAELIRLHAKSYPQHHWDQIEKINWDEQKALERWFSGLLKKEPPQHPRVLWLGLYNPVMRGKPTTGLYVAGSKTWSANDEWWGLERGTWWWPKLRYAKSRCLRDLYRHCYPTGPGNDGENLLALGYAARVLVELARVSDRELLLGGSVEVALAVGWDSGGPFDIGSLDKGGLRIRTAAETAAEESRRAIAAEKYFAELDAKIQADARAEVAAAFRHFSHADGRRWSIAAIDDVVHLEFTDSTGNEHKRTLTGFEGSSLAAAGLISEQLAAGFVELPKAGS